MASVQETFVSKHVNLTETSRSWGSFKSRDCFQNVWDSICRRENLRIALRILPRFTTALNCLGLVYQRADGTSITRNTVDAILVF